MKTITKIALLLLIVSCTKEIETVTMEMHIVYNDSSCEDATPTYILMETDKGLFELDYQQVPGGGKGTIEIPVGVYRISSVKLFDKDSNVTHFVYEGVPEDVDNNPVVSWTNDYKYDLGVNNRIIFQAFCTGYQFPF